MFKQTIKVAENVYRDIAGLDMSYEEVKEVFVEKHGEMKILIIFILIDKGRKVKVNIVFVAKTKLFFSTVFQKQILSKVIYLNRKINSVKKDNVKKLDGLADLQSKVKQTNSEEKLGKRGFHFERKDVF